MASRSKRRRKRKTIKRATLKRYVAELQHAASPQLTVKAATTMMMILDRRKVENLYAVAEVRLSLS